MKAALATLALMTVLKASIVCAQSTDFGQDMKSISVKIGEKIKGLGNLGARPTPAESNAYDANAEAHALKALGTRFSVTVKRNEVARCNCIDIFRDKNLLGSIEHPLNVYGKDFHQAASIIAPLVSVAIPVQYGDGSFADYTRLEALLEEAQWIIDESNGKIHTPSSIIRYADGKTTSLKLAIADNRLVQLTATNANSDKPNQVLHFTLAGEPVRLGPK